ncbi:N-acetylmuramoyl-L-alanine amidase [Acidicapsa ligni]|uniref:N-acetylmuramoyl-L-alanine amidase n=1 Tax=Acidicapsa ligni TaxID=542300 RepID=UPI0021E0CC27|nr:N-acetylmuramoyl-L-alanine amidase [Acidicapsa ligni]
MVPPFPLLQTVQKHSSPRLASVPFCTAAVLVLTALTPLTASFAARKLDPWDRAVALRQKLDSTPAEQRTREQYENAMDAFRLIYHEDPGASKSPAAVAQVADLLAEKGRVLKDDRALRAAIGQYEFLRQNYPKSPQVDNVLLLEGEICRQDLKDIACAKEKLQAVIDAAPNSSFAEQAALDLREMQPHNSKDSRNARNLPTVSATPTGRQRSTSKMPVTSASSALPSPDVQDQREATQKQDVSSMQRTDSPGLLPTPEPAQSGSHRSVMITGMRHWSNPTSTRIAIDLGGKVEYEAARVPNPDRIFFDLHGARLAPSLNGRQVEVIDDGYLKRIRAAQFLPDVTRVVLDVTDVSQYSAFLLPNPWRLIIDIHSDVHSDRQDGRSTVPETRYSLRATPAPPNTENTVADVAKLSTEPAKIQATAGPTSAPVSAKVKTAFPTTSSTTSPATKPDESQGASADTAGSTQSASQTSADQAKVQPNNKTKRKGRASSSPPPVAADEAPPLPHAADPTSDGQRSLVRALGLKVGRIVIDAGHGGHDSGTLGPGGIQEKDVVLDVALRTGKLLHQQLGAEIVYTRSDDTFIPLETRTAIANKAQADLFLSIHANSSSEPAARGVETYYLNFTSDPSALDVAARENAVSSSSVHQLSDLVRQIALKDKIDESREFAADVDQGLFAGLKSGNPGLKDRGVKKAPFVVLIGAQMPSILAEISFLTNPDDAQQLREGAYRQRIAESLAAGVERYLRGLSGIRPVSGKSSARGLGGGEEPAGR